MSVSKNTIWQIEPHTQAKHAILRRYLAAWLPILTRGGFPRVLYIDGFAGPGRYTGGEDGSPVIAVNEARTFGYSSSWQIDFCFVELDGGRADHLKAILSDIQLPSNLRWSIYDRVPFNSAYQRIRTDFAQSGRALPPTLAFIDPFGWNVSFDVVRDILSIPSCEVLITFMYQEINRFLSKEDIPDQFDQFFGCRDWEKCRGIQEPRARNIFLHDLYCKQLRESARAKFVRSFMMRNRQNSLDYYLIYATNNILGLKRMKEAMWRVDKSGDFSFSDITDSRQTVLLEEANLSELRSRLLKRFANQVVTIGQIENFVVCETPFRETHYKRILKDLETATPKAISVLNAPPKRNRGTYSSPDLKIHFDTNALQV